MFSTRSRTFFVLCLFTLEELKPTALSACILLNNTFLPDWSSLFWSQLNHSHISQWNVIKEWWIYLFSLYPVLLTLGKNNVKWADSLSTHITAESSSPVHTVYCIQFQVTIVFQMCDLILLRRVRFWSFVFIIVFSFSTLYLCWARWKENVFSLYCEVN